MLRADSLDVLDLLAFPEYGSEDVFHISPPSFGNLQVTSAYQGNFWGRDPTREVPNFSRRRHGW